ncbi:MAG TPA: hypothetical protein PLX80_10735 [Ignavibacteria bacterium]|nr:hypothetical protein [Ignavibacteria bacterium]
MTKRTDDKSEGGQKERSFTTLRKTKYFDSNSDLNIPMALGNV